MADYSRDIIQLLLHAPEGLQIRKIVRHVYNAHNTFFETVDLEDVKNEVTRYLLKKSKDANSPIVRTEERGVYKLNLESQESQQLMLQFSDYEEEPQQESSSKDDQSLDLFAGMM